VGAVRTALGALVLVLALGGCALLRGRTPEQREIVVELPDEEMGEVPMHNIVPRLSETPGKLRRPAPRLGEHSAALLAEIGCDPAEQAALAAAGVIRLDGEIGR
jgi:crotonobetainyl-CoA:carnitine CoA-transferase CaiB-like acyl-CoA transferase